ncbi:MAG: DUF4199 domain-containing protein [Flavobacteriaceae bacterium]
MENQTTSSKSIMINYGLILGLISILISVTVYATGHTYDQHWSVGVVSFLIMVAVIVMGIKKFKESNGGFLKLGEAIKIGMGIALISGIVSVVYTFIFTSYIEPDFFTNLIQVQEQKWIDAGMADDQIENAKVMMEKMSGFSMTAGFAVIGSVFFGFIISLISGLIMKESDEEITSI